MFQMQSTKMLLSGHRWERKSVPRVREVPALWRVQGFEGENNDKDRGFDIKLFRKFSQNRLPGKLH